MEQNSEEVLRVFLLRSRQAIEKPLLPQKLTAMAEAVVEAGLFRRVAFQLYADQYGEKLFGWAGLTHDEEVWLKTHDTLGAEEYGLVREHGTNLGNLYFVSHEQLYRIYEDPDAYFLSSDIEWKGPGYWHPDDMLYAPLLSSRGEPLGNVTADEPFNHRIPTEETAALLTPFLAIASVLVEQSLDRRIDTLTSCFSAPFFRDEMLRLESTGDLEGLLFMDMDNLKQVNDLRGHAAGDRLIQQTAHQLQAMVIDIIGPATRVFRLHGDEFVVLLRTGTKPLPQLILQLRQYRDEHIPYISIGGASYQRGMAFFELTREAEQAMYEDKWSRKEPISR